MTARVFTSRMTAEQLDQMHPEIRAHVLQATFRMLADRADGMGLVADMRTVVVRLVTDVEGPDNLLFEVSAHPDAGARALAEKVEPILSLLDRRGLVDSPLNRQDVATALTEVRKHL